MQRSRNSIFGAEQGVSPATGPNPAEICGDAAEHMAKARQALEAESVDANEAMDHLDTAISCLKGLTRPSAIAEEAPEPTVVPFQLGKQQRSA